MTKAALHVFLFAALVSCSPKASKQFIKPYVPPSKVVDDDMNSESYVPKADILFVVDNSGSMSSHQANMASNIGLFTSVFLKQSIIDYNIAVISTDMDGFYGEPWGGRFAGSTRIVNNLTPNGDIILSQNLQLGTGGSATEMMFDPVFAALSQQNLSGWNAGFLRDDATLIVIFLSDAADQSEAHRSPLEMKQFLLDLKKGDARKVLGFGALVPSGDNRCSRDSWEAPVTVESFLSEVRPIGSAVGENVLNLCALDYGSRLAKFAGDIVEQVTSFIPLSRAPVPGSIRVHYGNIDLPQDYDKGWSYDPGKNVIRLGREIDWSSQPVGSRVTVYYDAAHFEGEK